MLPSVYLSPCDGDLECSLKNMFVPDTLLCWVMDDVSAVFVDAVCATGKIHFWILLFY